MKSLKTLVAAALIVSSASSFALAKDINTIAGTMTVPNTVSVGTASAMNTVDFAKASMTKNLASAKLSREKRVEYQSALDAFQQLGMSYDVYQLQGADATGQKDALLVAVDLKSVVNEASKGKAYNPIFEQIQATVNAGELDPITEQFLIASVNMALPKQKTTYTLPNKNKPSSIYVSTDKGSVAYGVIGGKDDKADKADKAVTITVEDTELMEKLPSTKYQTYTVGSRVSFDSEGLQFPYYAQAALVMNPKKPTLYIAFTSDVQRQYFMPILKDAFKSIK